MIAQLTILIGLRPKFRLGQIVATANCYHSISDEDRAEAIARHAQGDWGTICEEDRLLNEQGLENDNRLLSVYQDSNDQEFWIITEWDRSVTTLLMPEDY